LGLVDAPGTSPGLRQPWAGGRNRFAVKTENTNYKGIETISTSY
jgi:hypothetical protein